MRSKSRQSAWDGFELVSTRIRLFCHPTQLPTPYYVPPYIMYIWSLFFHRSTHESVRQLGKRFRSRSQMNRFERNACTIRTARQEFEAATKAMKLLRQMQLDVAEAHRLYNDLVKPFIGVTKGWLHIVQILLGSPYPTLRRKMRKTIRISIHKATSSDEVKRIKSILRADIVFRHDALYRTI